MRTSDWYVFYNVHCDKGDIILPVFLKFVWECEVSQMRPGGTETKWLTAGGGILQW